MTSFNDIKAFINRGQPSSSPAPSSSTPPLPSGSTPAYGDVFKYMNAGLYAPQSINYVQPGQMTGTSADPYQFTQAQWNTDNSDGGRDFGGGASGENGLSGGYTEGGGDNSTTLTKYTPMTMQTNNANIPKQYQGIVNYNNLDTDKGPNALSGFQVNGAVTSKLPSTKFGDVGNVMNLDANGNANGGAMMINPNLKYYDPNYGWITPKANLTNHETGVEKYAVPVLQGLAGAAFGGLTGPLGGLGAKIGLAGVNAAASLGNGANWKQTLLSMAPGLITGGLGMGGVSLPPQLAQALQYAKMGYGAYNMMKRT